MCNYALSHSIRMRKQFTQFSNLFACNLQLFENYAGCCVRNCRFWPPQSHYYRILNSSGQQTPNAARIHRRCWDFYISINRARGAIASTTATNCFNRKTWNDFRCAYTYTHNNLHAHRSYSNRCQDIISSKKNMPDCVHCTQSNIN